MASGCWMNAKFAWFRHSKGTRSFLRQKGIGYPLARRRWILRVAEFTIGLNYTEHGCCAREHRGANHRGGPDGGDGFRSRPRRDPEIQTLVYETTSGLGPLAPLVSSTSDAPRGIARNALRGPGNPASTISRRTHDEAPEGGCMSPPSRPPVALGRKRRRTSCGSFTFPSGCLHRFHASPLLPRDFAEPHHGPAHRITGS